jgi:hypothetical protein
MNWEYQQVMLSGMCSRYSQSRSLKVTTDNPQAPIISTVLDTHNIACNIYVEHQTATVDMETGQLLALLPPPVLSPPSNWKAWTAFKGDNTWDIWSPPAIDGYKYHHEKWVSKCFLTDCDLGLNTLKFVYPFRSGAAHPVKICMTQISATCYGISLLEL